MAQATDPFWLDAHSGAVQAVTAAILAVLTFVYVLLTRRLAKSTAESVARSREATERTAALGVMVDVFREWRINDSILAGRSAIRLYRLRHKQPPPTSNGYRSLPAEVIAVSHYFDNLGAMVIRGVVSVATVQVFIGDVIVSAWNFFEPYCAAERALRGGPTDEVRAGQVPYQMNFEFLALSLLAQSQSSERMQLLQDLRALRAQVGAANRVASVHDAGADLGPVG